MRLTKIICTLGPATNTPEKIQALAHAGMNIARLNFSHGDQEGHRKTIAAIKALNASGECIAIMIDTKGPEIRTGDVTEPIVFEKGQEAVFSSHPLPGETLPVILVNYEGFATDVKDAACILIDNGDMSFELVDIRPDGSVRARAQDAGKIGSRRHVNLPGADVSLPSVTEKDWSDLALGIEEKVDFIALSFIRTGEAVREVKKFLRENGSEMRVISKIETQRAVESIDDIIEASDGIMVARGDLGAEIPFELVPAIQDSLVRKCREAGKPVIVATHMLESMIQNPMPTRAEVTDVAHAATTRSDCTMLSGETAAGKHPIAAVTAMDRILRETEKHLPPMAPNDQRSDETIYTARAQAAVTMAEALKAPAIVVLTRSGKSAQSLSMLRPTIPIITLADSPETQRRIQILYGVKALQIDFSDDREKNVDDALLAARDTKLLESGQRVVVVSDAETKSGIVSSVQIRMIP